MTKLLFKFGYNEYKFESDVILYSDKTMLNSFMKAGEFESDVILYSDKTGSMGR